MLEVIILILAGCGAGIINAVAGGGNLLVLPAFLALGLSPFVAAITGSVTVLAASSASVFGYRKDLQTLPRQYFMLLIPAALGAVVGVFLLYHTPGNVFAKLLPWLVMLAVALYIFQPWLHKRLRKPAHHRSKRSIYIISGGLFLACVYGGYFGAGVGFLILALFGFLNIKHIFQMTGLKSLVTCLLSLITVVTFSVSGQLAWKYGLLTAIGSAFGGYIGARLSHRISPHMVRLAIILIGVTAISMTFIKAYR